MQPAAAKLKVALDQITFQTPRFPVIANVTAKAGDRSEPSEEICWCSRSLRRCSGWQRLRNSIGLGVRRFVEIGPGKVLSGLVKRTLQDVEIMSLDKLPDFDLVGGKLLEAV